MRNIASLIFLAFLAAAPLAAQPYHQRRGVVEDALNARYERAIYEASVYDRANVRPLRPLTPDANGEVLVASLTSINGNAGELLTVGGSGIWVTGVPEVQEKCRMFQGDVLMRLRQLLGLPPDAHVERFLVFRARAVDIFRPAPDGRVTTTLPCPTLAGAPIPQDCGNAFPAETTPEHYAWIAQQSFRLHVLSHGYPWTHLGYTYDWAPGLSGHYGASEYVLRPGASVLIVQNVDPLTYCGATSPPPAAASATTAPAPTPPRP